MAKWVIEFQRCKYDLLKQARAFYQLWMCVLDHFPKDLKMDKIQGKN